MGNIKLISLLFFTAAVLVMPSYAGTAVPKPTPSDKPVYTAYRGIEIGMAAADVHKKLGTPKDTADRHEDYVFSDDESAQIFLDGDGKVMAIAVTYVGKLDKAPSAKDVFGEDAEVKPDGGVFRMERYPKAGFWISYTKTGGDDPMIMLAMQKM